jgi:hypothetical protein
MQHKNGSFYFSLAPPPPPLKIWDTDFIFPHVILHATAQLNQFVFPVALNDPFCANNNPCFADTRR